MGGVSLARVLILAVASIVLATLAAVVLSAAPPLLAQPVPQWPESPGPRALTIDRRPAAGHVVHLSFDAGADRGYAGEILNTLAAEGVSASFGMTGRWAQENPDLVQRMVAEGHRLINHTWDHRSFTGNSDRRGGQNREQIHAQLARTEALLVELTGQNTQPSFGPPYGDYSTAVLDAVYGAG